MKKDKAYYVAFIGVMSALIMVLFLLESFVLAGFGITACILSLPVAIALSIFDDWKKSFIGGTILGVCSCVFCLIGGAGFIFYANPLISVLPRFFIGITAYWTYFGLSKLFRKVKFRYLREVLPCSIAGVVGSITNTVLYLLSVSVWMGQLDGALGAMLAVAATIYFPIELAACFVLVPLYVMALKKVNHRITKKKVAVEAGESNAPETDSAAKVEK